jgi:hypothetical protein
MQQPIIFLFDDGRMAINYRNRRLDAHVGCGQRQREDKNVSIKK